MVFFIAFPVALRFAINYINWCLSRCEDADIEKCSPYECGFEPFSKIRQRFSVRFFLIAILFVIFDVEVCIITPFIFCLFDVKTVQSIFSFIFFISVIYFGLLHEFREGSLEWVS